jgi:hypothetical protein
MGLSGVGLAAKWLRGLDLNQRPLGYECPATRLLPLKLPRLFPYSLCFQRSQNRTLAGRVLVML